MGRHSPGEIHLPQANHTEEGKEHRHLAVSVAAEHTQHDLPESHEAVEGDHKAHEGSAEGDDLRRPGEQADKGLCENAHGQGKTVGDDHREQQTAAGTFPGTALVLCADILAHEGSDRGTEGFAGQGDEFVQLLGHADACHGSGAEASDVAPHKEIGERDQGALHAGGKADVEDVGDHRRVQLQSIR